MSLKINSLSKSYDGKTFILKDFTLEIESEKFTALLGPSGCGKTTLLRTLAGLETLDDGEITFKNECWARKSPKHFVAPEARNISMVFQSYALWPHMTVFENLAYPLKVRGAPKIEVSAKVKAMMEVVELSEFKDRLPGLLSGGQQQRVALARALIQKPNLLLMDEPLSNLDASLRAQMRSEIKRLHNLYKLTSIIVTHDWDDAAALCDYIVIIKDGKIEQKGSPSEIISNPASDFVAKICQK